MIQNNVACLQTLIIYAQGKRLHLFFAMYRDLMFIPTFIYHFRITELNYIANHFQFHNIEHFNNIEHYKTITYKFIK